MKFKIGKNYEEWLAEKNARDALFAKHIGWHPWYAWHPVKVALGDWRWLEWVQRRGNPHRSSNVVMGWTYKAKVKE